jgi:hypothetical protein
MGINDGFPQPTMAMKVGVGRERSSVVVTEAARVRMNS